MVDWYFYKGMAQELMDDAAKWDADYRNIKKAHIMAWAKEHNLNGHNLWMAYTDIKRTYTPEWLS